MHGLRITPLGNLYPVEDETASGAAPEQRPEGRLLADALARHVPKMTQREAARRAEISETRWRQIVQGYQQLQDGVRAPVTAPADTLARMALAVGLTARDLVRAERPDAVEALIAIRAQVSITDARRIGEGPIVRAVAPGVVQTSTLEVAVSMQAKRVAELQERLEQADVRLNEALLDHRQVRSVLAAAIGELRDLQNRLAAARQAGDS